MKTQKETKKMELEYLTRQSGYTNIMKSISTSYVSARNQNKQNLLQSIDKIEATYYDIEPLMSDNDKKRIWTDIQNFQGFCLNSKTPILNDTVYSDACLKYRYLFRNDLQKALFDHKNLE